MSERTALGATMETMTLEEPGGEQDSPRAPGPLRCGPCAVWPRQQTWLCVVPLLMGFVGLGLSLMLLKWIVVGSVQDYVPTDLVNAKGIGQDPIFLSKPSTLPKGPDAPTASTATPAVTMGPGSAADGTGAVQRTQSGVPSNHTSSGGAGGTRGAGAVGGASGNRAPHLHNRVGTRVNGTTSTTATPRSTTVRKPGGAGGSRSAYPSSKAGPPSPTSVATSTTAVTTTTMMKSSTRAPPSSSTPTAPSRPTQRVNHGRPSKGSVTKPTRPHHRFRTQSNFVGGKPKPKNRLQTPSAMLCKRCFVDLLWAQSHCFSYEEAEGGLRRDPRGARQGDCGSVPLNALGSVSVECARGKGVGWGGGGFVNPTDIIVIPRTPSTAEWRRRCQMRRAVKAEQQCSEGLHCSHGVGAQAELHCCMSDGDGGEACRLSGSHEADSRPRRRQQTSRSGQRKRSAGPLGGEASQPGPRRIRAADARAGAWPHFLDRKKWAGMLYGRQTPCLLAHRMRKAPVFRGFSEAVIQLLRALLSLRHVRRRACLSTKPVVHTWPSTLDMGALNPECSASLWGYDMTHLSMHYEVLLRPVAAPSFTRLV
ncbi:hypothetical protein P4O66_001464 [Electrophorus voltai]|uniref:Uncharacterized protein n=1 Tax=Electrophorus voltai TaxID=2609070 RepID=A0AAD9DW44_9TELE|nr:hypothetical protein P4O66_001464 [Electrophorus voltai]